LSEIPQSIPQPHHKLNVDARLGPLHLRAHFNLSAPWTVIFGPSGSGKSSLLRAACGLLESPTIGFSERSRSSTDWFDLDTPDRKTPPHLRSIGYAPQGAILFPHLSVEKNVSFSADSHHHHADSAQIISDSMSLFDLGPLADRMPRNLSGGERQRVNLARAFAVPGAQLLLLDEPFTGVDRGLRDALIPRMKLRIAQLGIPVLSVTHDVEEALLLGAEVIRLEQGAVLAQGPAPQVLAEERARMLKILQP
jgi:molybdate transport system ATP-binding protein